MGCASASVRSSASPRGERGFAGPLLVGSTVVALSRVVLATTFEPRRWGEAGVATLVMLALPLHHDLVGAPGFVVNAVFAGLALLSATRLHPRVR